MSNKARAGAARAVIASSASASASRPPAPLNRETTALEAHLSMLQTLASNAQQALNRVATIADRYFGPEIGKATMETASDRPAPPMVQQIEEASRDLGQLIQGIQEQINRLEKL